MTFDAGTAARVLPTAALAAAAWGLAWLATGSIASPDWLPYAFLGTLLLAVVLFSGTAVRPSARELCAIAAFFALAGWAAVSISWSAVPDLARDEALLTLFYGLAFLVPLLTLRSAGDRLFASAAVAASSGILAVGVGIVLRFGSDQSDHFYSGRLSYPISYPNAQAAVFLIGFWPAVVLASQRGRGLVARALALAAATAISAGWLTAHSKGGGIASAASAVLVFALSPLRLRLLPAVLLSAGMTAAAYSPLTAPFRTNSVSDVKGAGSAILILTFMGAAIGLVYALAHRRLHLGPRGVRAAGVAAVALFVAGLAVVLAIFFGRVYHQGWFGDQWRSFKHAPSSNVSSHLLALGSYRYEIWRVALDEFADHPQAGIGSRGFGPAHGSGGWIWTVPACGLPFWLLLGAGASGGDRRPLAMKAAVPAAAVAVVLAVVAFVPPWLSARFTDRGQYRWAKRFDPLSVDPYITQSSISALQAAVRKEPRVVEWRFDLAQAYQRARELKKARAELEHARRLDPADPRIQEALRNLPKRSIRSS